MACLFLLKLHSLFSPAGMIAADLLTYIRHLLGNLTQFNISKLASNQLVLNNDGSLGWGDSSAVILPLTVLCIYTPPSISRQWGLLKTTWGMFKMEWVELLYIARVFGCELAWNQFHQVRQWVTLPNRRSQFSQVGKLFVTNTCLRKPCRRNSQVCKAKDANVSLLWKSRKKVLLGFPSSNVRTTFSLQIDMKGWKERSLAGRRNQTLATSHY